MKDILIVFCVLLVLLIIITALGGSIRPSEPYTTEDNEEEPAADPVELFAQYKAPAARHPVSIEEETRRDTFINNVSAEDVIGYDSTESFASL